MNINKKLNTSRIARLRAVSQLYTFLHILNSSNDKLWNALVQIILRNTKFNNALPLPFKILSHTSLVLCPQAPILVKNIKKASSASRLIHSIVKLLICPRISLYAGQCAALYPGTKRVNKVVLYVLCWRSIRDYFNVSFGKSHKMTFFCFFSELRDLKYSHRPVLACSSICILIIIQLIHVLPLPVFQVFCHLYNSSNSIHPTCHWDNFIYLSISIIFVHLRRNVNELEALSFSKMLHARHHADGGIVFRILTGIINKGGFPTLDHISTSLPEEVHIRRKDKKNFEERRGWHSTNSRCWRLL